MDIYCPKCGEPWDIDSLHGEVEVRLADMKMKLKLRRRP